MIRRFARITISALLFAVCFVAYIAVRDGWREERIQANKGKIIVGMSEAEVISLLGEPTSKAMSDHPNLIWCYGTDTWRHWDAGDNYCGMTSLQMSPDGRVVRPPR